MFISCFLYDNKTGPCGGSMNVHIMFLYDNTTGPCGDSVNVHVMFSIDISVLLFLQPLYLLSPLYPYERT